MSRPITRVHLTPEQRARHAENCRRWRALNHERSNEIARKGRRKWHAANLKKSKAIQAENRRRVRLQVLELLGGPRCARCGFDDWRALQIDHRNGGGHRERMEGGVSTRQLWKHRAWIIENPEAARAKYQVLCANCNWIKRHERLEFGGPIL